MLACSHAYMTTCLHAYLPTCLHAHMPTCLYAYLLTCLHAYMLTCLHACMLTCLHAYMLTCLHAYMLTCLHAYMLTCLHAYMPTCLHAYMLWSAAPLLAYNIASVRPPAAHPILAGLVFQAYSCAKCHHMRSTVSADTSYLMSCPDHGITCFTMGNLTVLDGHQLTIAPNL